MEAIDQILKQDSAGRVWTPLEQRNAALDAFETSALPATKFAVQIGVKYQTFISWVRKRRKERAGSAGAEPRRRAVPLLNGWIEAAVPLGGGGVLVVQLPGGARMEVADAAQAALAASLLRSLSTSGVSAAC